ncbi:ArgE/DapE family deacylase [bacterium]|nr:ArgE/DapE family deacylase [bacterium]
MAHPAPVPDHATLQAAIAARRDWAVTTLADLVRHPSVLGQEASAQEHMAGLLDGLGLDVRHEPIDLARIRDLPGFSPVDWELDGKLNVVGVHDPGPAIGRSLALNGHIDVVSPEPVAAWTTPPYEPRVVDHEEDGESWMYGRGAGDMKGGTVAALWALAALQDLDREPASRVLVQSPVEEECTGNGTLSLLERGYVADACIIPEPFGETLLVRQVGVMWFQVRILGRTTHVLGAGRGVNAIEKSWLVIQALRELEEELNADGRRPDGFAQVDHPLNLNVGTIAGGDWASTVAGECVTRFRIGLYPGDDLAAMRATIEERVARAAAADPWLREDPPTVEYIGFQAAGCEFDPASDLARTLTEHHRAWRGTGPAELACTATTDIRFFNLYYDIPATCYGPRAERIHGPDEKVSLDSMQRVAEVLASVVADWCGLRPRGRSS